MILKPKKLKKKSFEKFMKKKTLKTTKPVCIYNEVEL